VSNANPFLSTSICRQSLVTFINAVVTAVMSMSWQESHLDMSVTWNPKVEPDDFHHKVQ